MQNERRATHDPPGRPHRRSASTAALAVPLVLLAVGGVALPQVGQAAPQVVDRPKVTLPAAPVKLLPLDVRLRRIAAAVGLTAEDRVFDAVREQRLALGAHDFVNGTAPDLQWNAQRMATWITAMLPVCRDTRVRSYIGDWKQGGMDKFIQGAFGRASTADDLADLSAALAISGDDGWVAACLSLVTSAEMVLQ